MTSGFRSSDRSRCAARAPTPLAVTVCRLRGIEGSTLRVEGLDLVDGTPVLDVKPYIAVYDAVPDAQAAAVGAGVTTAAPALDATRLDRAYEALVDAYGPQGWWPVDGPPRDRRRFEVCVGAILVQHARWESAAEAVARLRDAGVLSVEALATLPLADIEALIRGAGTYRSKARTLRSFAEHVRATGGAEPSRTSSTPTGRRCAATASTCGASAPRRPTRSLLYAAGSARTFVVDAYARRLFARLGCRASRRV